MVYEGAAPTGTQHVADLTSLPSTPLDYCQEVRKSLSVEEAARLAYPSVLTSLQQELLSWHFRPYHLPFWQIFALCEAGYLPKRLLKCKSKPPTCTACQFGQAHRRPWQVKGKKACTIRKKTDKLPGDGTSIDQIVSAQPGRSVPHFMWCWGSSSKWYHRESEQAVDSHRPHSPSTCDENVARHD